MLRVHHLLSVVLVVSLVNSSTLNKEEESIGVLFKDLNGCRSEIDKIRISCRLVQFVRHMAR